MKWQILVIVVVFTVLAGGHARKNPNDLAGFQTGNKLKKEEMIVDKMVILLREKMRKQSHITECTDTCGMAGNYRCDDGAEAAETSNCAYGSDCTDCGVRPVCTNDCRFAFDGECDDGGPGHHYNACLFGSDCADCGDRTGFDDSCIHAKDGQCDDGGEGSEFTLCRYGTDSTDCGIRSDEGSGDGDINWLLS